MQTQLSNSLRETFGLFDTVPKDYLQFGIGDSFNPKLVQTTLSLKKEDISRLASVSVSSVRYDEHIPDAVRDLFCSIVGWWWRESDLRRDSLQRIPQAQASGRATGIVGW